MSTIKLNNEGDSLAEVLGLDYKIYEKYDKMYSDRATLIRDLFVSGAEDNESLQVIMSTADMIDEYYVVAMEYTDDERVAYAMSSGTVERHYNLLTDSIKDASLFKEVKKRAEDDSLSEDESMEAKMAMIAMLAKVMGKD